MKKIIIIMLAVLMAILIACDLEIPMTMTYYGIDTKIRHWNFRADEYKLLEYSDTLVFQSKDGTRKDIFYKKDLISITVYEGGKVLQEINFHKDFNNPQNDDTSFLEIYGAVKMTESFTGMKLLPY